MTKTSKIKLECALIHSIITEFESKVQCIFGHNLIFSFIFGSIAKGYATTTDDIDIFICLRQRSIVSERNFLEWLRDLHQRNGLTIDCDYPTEIVTLQDLDSALVIAASTPLTLEYQSHDVFDRVVWIQVLSDRKIGVVGDYKILSSYETQCAKYPEVWKQQMIHQLQDADPLITLKRTLRFLERPGSSSSI